MPKPTSTGLTRRTFIKSSAALAALAAMPAYSRARILGANERINMGVIGVGGQGTYHVRDMAGRFSRDNITCDAICDVYQRRIDNAVNLVASAGGHPTSTMEYRELIDSDGVDAILIATPDHWHTKIAIEAMEAGKDVYVEKPLSLTVEQALECRDAVKRTGRVLQVGPNLTADDNFWRGREAIRKNRIGKVTWSQGSYCRNSVNGQFNWSIDDGAGPSGSGADKIWWDRWLGWEWDLAERIPWNPDHFFRFRKYWAYNGGVATDLLYHRLAPLLLAITGPDGEYPKRVSASGGQYIEKDGRDIPDNFMMMVDYPSEHTVVLISVMTNDDGIPLKIRGQHGTMEFEDGITLTEQRAWSKQFRATNRDKLEGAGADAGSASFTIPRESRRDLKGNFWDVIRGDDKQLHCNVDLGASTMVAIKMGVEAYRNSRTLVWDAERERVIS